MGEMLLHNSSESMVKLVNEILTSFLEARSIETEPKV